MHDCDYFLVWDYGAQYLFPGVDSIAVFGGDLGNNFCDSYLSVDQT